MNTNKTSKVESSCANKEIGQFLGSFTASKASSSRQACSPKKNVVKTSLTHSSNKTARNIFDGSKTLKFNLSCKRVVCSPSATKPSSSSSSQASLLKKNDVLKTPLMHSLNTTRKWNASCRNLLCSFGGSSSIPSAAKKKPIDGSCQDQLEAPRGTNRERQLDLGSKADRSQQSNPAHLSKQKPVAVMKRNILKTRGAKDPQAYDLRNRVQKTERPKDSPAYSLRSKTQKSEGPKGSAVVNRKTRILETAVSKDSSAAKGTRKIEVQKTHGPKNSVPNKKTGTTKLSTSSLAGHDNKNESYWRQYERGLHDPVYHIRWDGYENESEPQGNICIFCNKDLSCSPQGIDSRFDEDYRYEDDYDGEFTPRLLPGVAILWCGHAFHSECLQHNIPEEQSTDPICILCSSMA